MQKLRCEMTIQFPRRLNIFAKDFVQYQKTEILPLLSLFFVCERVQFLVN